MSVTRPQAAREDRRAAYEAARLRLARLRVAGEGSLRGVLREATRIAARALDVDRVGIWLFVADRTSLRCSELYERVRDEYCEGAAIQRADFPNYFAALEERRVITAADASAHAATSELAANYLVPLGIGAMLDAPIYRAGSVIGVVCHERLGGPHEWTQEDKDFATSVADTIALLCEGAARQDNEAVLRAHEAYVGEVQRMEALGRLSAGVSHDFRNILTIVLGHAGLIENNAATPPDMRAEAARIRGAAERGILLTRELSMFGRTEEIGPPSVVHVPAVITGFIEVLRGAAGRRHVVEIEAPPDVGQVLVSPAQLERVLLNLVLNARDALPAGGTIRIRVHERFVPDDGEQPGHYIVIDVIDEGEGMDEKTRARIFEPFFTTKPEGHGTGLGLAIAYRVVERAGGFFRIASAPGRGTTMSVHLPRVAAPVG